MACLQTERLNLFPLSPDQLRQYQEDPESLEADLGLALSRALLSERVRRAIGMKLEKMARAGPEAIP
ncbi:MAG: hypothetical protein JW929_13990 [Anaerolineales bacterium]|nr:hypothetical protein [Anaerolineales bacterium]